MIQQVRLFIAVPITSAEVQRAAAGLLDHLRGAGADYKWVDPENLHLTLSYHGSALPEQIPVLKKAMAKAAAGRKAFSLGLEGLGAFDSLDSPRVVWVGIGGGVEVLRDIVSALHAALQVAGLLGEDEKNREFRGHLTLGRMRSRRNQERLKEFLNSAPSKLGALSVDRLALYESCVSSSGPRYVVRAEVELGLRV